MEAPPWEDGCHSCIHRRGQGTEWTCEETNRALTPGWPEGNGWISVSPGGERELCPRFARRRKETAQAAGGE